MTIEPIMFVVVRYSFWQRIPRFIEHIWSYGFPPRQAWIASGFEINHTGWERQKARK